MFQLFATDVLDTGGKLPAGVIDTGGNLPLVVHTGVITVVVHLDLRISQRIFEKFVMTPMLFSGAWGKMIHEKKPAAENLMDMSL